MTPPRTDRVLKPLLASGCSFSARTVVMVSHRLKLAAIADQVVVLDGGQIREQGEPRVLLTAGSALLTCGRSRPAEPEDQASESCVGTSDIVVPLDRAR